ncbi:hypothetical protein V2I01_04800 [Micromonospora sp. BRA006-A]|nr:hypothetical protein [Micromonospora sp. BRA006-A]
MTSKQRADANKTALLSMAQAFNTEAEAGERSGISAAKASEAYATNRARLVAMAQKAGMSKKAAEELAASMLTIPRNVKTDVNVNTKTAASQVETIKKSIQTIKGKTVTITVQVLRSGNHRMPGGGQLTSTARPAQRDGGPGRTARRHAPADPRPCPSSPP